MVHLTTALDASSGVPLYEQLYRSLAGEMRSGTLAAGTRMPGKRRLAAELSVSVNTVDAAYQMLAAEGYLESRERSGFYVQEYLALPSRPAGGPEQPAPPKPEPPVLPVRYDLSTRGVDPELFPFRTWARLQKELLYSSPQLLTHGDAQGDPALRQALAEYLSEYRGVQCGPHQIVVGAGLEYLLGLLAPLLPGPAAVETPGYPRALQVLQNNGVHCCCLPVDEDGLSVEALNRSDAAVCYVTPSHQFPTGVTMPAGRRAELLHWAARRPGGRYIIEDDYDSEFRFDTRPLPSLQGMAGADGPVVYLSTCSRSLAPSIRHACCAQDHAEAVGTGAFGKLRCPGRGAVCRKDVRLKRDVQRFQLGTCALYHRPIAVRTHDHSHFTNHIQTSLSQPTNKKGCGTPVPRPLILRMLSRRFAQSCTMPLTCPNVVSTHETRQHLHH